MRRIIITLVKLKQKVLNQSYYCVVFLIIVLLVFIANRSFKSEIEVVYEDTELNYLINTETCAIIDSDPFHIDVKKFFRPEKYIPCTNHDYLLTYIKKASNLTHSVVTLHINKSMLFSYSYFNIKCCYMSITRDPLQAFIDDKISYSKCISFEEIAIITDSTIKVNCHSPFTTVYSNIYAIIPPKVEDKEEKENASQMNVLFVGIDSVSKLNLRRTMPKTYKYLESSDFINLRGYTKIEDNTFPNLMAILSGRTFQQIYQICNLHNTTLDNCYFIWQKFKEFGYSTAYAEDEAGMSTFNNAHKGFINPPTDYYFRPYVIATEELPSIQRHWMYYCTGPENSGERIMNLAKDFITTNKNDPKFGFFWMNSFSHNNINEPSSMDDKVMEFLEDLHPVLQNTMFVFFSDHGFRFGKIRQTYTGWVEERMPFIYVHLPHSLKENHPEAYNNFLVNSRRLTSPFDLYMTLQSVLRWANPNYSIQPSLGCPKCTSLFNEIPDNRTCSDAAIIDQWCLCSGYAYFSTSAQVTIDIAEMIVSKVNTLVQTYPERDKCAHFRLKKISYAAVTTTKLNKNNELVYNMMVMLKTRPSAAFEANIEISESGVNRFRLIGDISRINKYSSSTVCVKDQPLKKYCYCDGLFTSLISAICNFYTCV